MIAQLIKARFRILRIAGSILTACGVFFLAFERHGKNNGGLS